ncbi:Alpha/Beta hydrolase protein [Pseudomassariella vexata]|uniref:Alpha/Beta hydrolase protein n=1 Tax=Pseudomassariella vexata TaxID=1141098 RepID=A0A1Y2E1T7_9PEZI|nr:Alpha/Beta hydrolase protein [Pseudomassariella vexata]ORY65511.1 Alpha/Beta hydrolase protein [Pseudomassariella vexata]
MQLKSLIFSALAAFAAQAATLSNFDDWEHGRVALQDVSIHFRYHGTGPPLLLIHGNPQYSLTWRTIGPLLAQNYTVIAPDNRGAGDSSIPPDGNYSAPASAEDLKGVLDFLNITSAYVFSHDKGVGHAFALAAKYPALVKMLGVSEYLLPGFGYEVVATPAPYWDLYQNPQLAFFQIPDFAEFLMAGKERQFLEWYFYHGSYSGALSMSEDVVNRYTSSISKPGFLRAMLGPFSAASLAADASFFQGTVGVNPLSMHTLALGGEASSGVREQLRGLFANVTTSLDVDIVPKAGHWIADENPAWVARRVASFLATDTSPLPNIDLSYLADKVTLTVGFYGTLGNAALAGL